MKKSLKYWEKRKAQRMWEYMEDAETTAKEIAEIYYRSNRYLLDKSKGIFDTFKGRHNLSHKEAIELINNLKNPSDYQEMLNALKGGAFENDISELIKQLEAPAYASRLKRISNIQRDIDNTMQGVYKLENGINTKHYIKGAQKAYNTTIFDVQKATGFRFDFNHVSKKQIDTLLKSSWSGKNFSERIWNNTNDVAKELKKEIMTGVLTGKTEKDMAKVIAGKMQVGSNQARRLVRTESNYVAEEMEAQAYEECGATKYRFLATLDNKTSVECQQLDMKSFYLKEREVGKNYPPIHPWCRSTTIMDFDDDVLSSMKRRAGNETVSANTNYEEWKKQQGVRDDVYEEENSKSNDRHKIINVDIINDPVEIINKGESAVMSFMERKGLDDFRMDDYLSDNRTKRSMLEIINETDGFKGMPQVLSAKEFKKVDSDLLIRGLNGNQTDINKYIDELMYEEEFYTAKGLYGNGLYTGKFSEDLHKKILNDYAKGVKENIFEMKLDKSANIITYDDVNKKRKELRKYYKQNSAYDEIATVKSATRKLLDDNGRLAEIMGYDAIYVEKPDYMVILNRTKLIIKEVK